MILYRVNNTHEPKNSGYAGVEVRVSKEDFIEWFMQRDFEGCSVDRINNHGHYELPNMQVIETWRNIAKDKVKIKGGNHWCSRCKKYKPKNEMVKSSKRKLMGVTTTCKSCDVKRRRDRYSRYSEEQKEKNRQRCREYYYRKKAEREAAS